MLRLDFAQRRSIHDWCHESAFRPSQSRAGYPGSLLPAWARDRGNDLLSIFVQATLNLCQPKKSVAESHSCEDKHS